MPTKKDADQQRTNRPIRMSNPEWDDFKLLLGAEWLRGQIAKARAKADRAAK